MKNEEITKKVTLSKEGKWRLFTYKDEPTRGDFDSFKDRLYVKKGEYEDFENTELAEEWKNAITIKFDISCIDVEFVEKIYDHHLHLLLNKKAKTFADALQITFDYFANGFEEDMKKTLWGDIGEAIFILKTYEFTKINIINKIHLQDNGLYDFAFSNGKYIEIKTTSLDKNEVILSDSQIDYAQDRDFVIIKLKEIERATTIIDIYEKIKKEIGPLSDCLISKYENYKNSKWIEHFSVNLNSIQIGTLDNDSVPQFEIKNRSALKKAKFYLDVTDNVDPFESYIKAQDLS